MNAWADKPTLRGERVTLRPFRDGDAALMHACFDAEAIRLTLSAHTTAEAERAAAAEIDQRTLEWYATRNDQTDRLDLAVEDEHGELVGEVVLNDRDEANASCGFRILLGPRGRDRGLGPEAIRLLLDHAFGVLGLHRVELEYYPFNPRAGRAYEQVGFVEEGRRRDAVVFDGVRYDAIVMSVLAPEWIRARS